MCHWSACLFWLIGLPRNLFTELMSDEEHHDLQMVGDCGARAEDRSAEGGMPKLKQNTEKNGNMEKLWKHMGKMEKT